MVESLKSPWADEKNLDIELFDNLALKIGGLLAGQPSGIVGIVLADVVATWISGHCYSNPEAQEKLRDDLLALHITTVRRLIPLNEIIGLEFGGSQ